MNCCSAMFHFGNNSWHQIQLSLLFSLISVIPDSGKWSVEPKIRISRNPSLPFLPPSDPNPKPKQQFPNRFSRTLFSNAAKKLSRELFFLEIKKQQRNEFKLESWMNGKKTYVLQKSVVEHLADRMNCRGDMKWKWNSLKHFVANGQVDIFPKWNLPKLGRGGGQVVVSVFTF